MKQLRNVSKMLVALVLLAGVGSLIVGCKQPNDNDDTGSTSKRGIIEFDSASMKCQNANSIPYTDINSGAEINSWDALCFSAKLPAGKIVEGWYINDGSAGIHTSHFKYSVSPYKFVDGKTKISVKTKDGTNGNIEFDTTVICTFAGGTARINTASQIQEGDGFNFSATRVLGKKVKEWYINDAPQSKSQSNINHTVQPANFSSGSLKIRYEQEAATQGTIKFDTTKMTCENIGYTDAGLVSNNTPIQEQDNLRFDAPKGTVVDKWFVNGVEYASNTNTTSIFVTSAMLGTGEIEVSYTTK